MLMEAPINLIPVVSFDKKRIQTIIIDSVFPLRNGPFSLFLQGRFLGGHT